MLVLALGAGDGFAIVGLVIALYAVLEIAPLNVHMAVAVSAGQ